MRDRWIRETLTRRAALKSAVFGAAGLAVLGRAGLPAWAGKTVPAARRPGKAKAVIELWMAGGPSHIDTFDPKPGAGVDYTGPLAKAIPTNAPGMQLNESLPLLAQQADKFSIIRSLTHGVNAHETAAYIVQTGRKPGSGAGSDRVFPSFGAVASMFLSRDYTGMIPPYVVLTRPQGRFAVEGFLGIEHKPFVTGGDPRRDRFAVEGVVLDGVSDERQRSRRELLHELDTLGQALRGDANFRKMDACEDKAYDLILGDAGKAFDLKQEPDEVRERYGRTWMGQSCLCARRLVEAGVPYVTVNSGGWDTHKRHFESMRQKLPELDKAFAALLEDLAQRGLLDSTIVWWAGEFGRTPRVQMEEPWNGGRSHFGPVFSAVVAGGGFKGGQVIGASDERAMEVVDRPVYAPDLHGSMYELLGVDPDGPLPNPRGIEVTVTEPSAQGAHKGRLKEIL